MADIRIKDLAVTASASSSDDYLAVDGSTNGTRKLSAYSPTFGGAVTSSGSLTAGGDITLSTNNAFLKGKTSGGSTVNLMSLTSDSITRFIAGVDAGGFQWTNQAQATAWASLTSSLLTVTGNLTVSGGSITNGAGTAVYYFGTPSNNYLYYDGSSLYTRVGGSDRMTISGSTGNVLIGTTTDGGQKLQVNGDGKFSGSVYAEKSGAGFIGQSTGAITQVTTVNSTTYNVTTGSAKVFVVQLASGDAALCYASYKSSTITILGSDGTIVNSSSPDTGQLGIYKSANDHVISFKTGSNALSGGYASWGFCFLGNPIISIA